MTEFFIQKGVHRNSVLVAIGGGATTDIAGFVASTLLRGIKWVAAPTTFSEWLMLDWWENGN